MIVWHQDLLMNLPNDYLEKNSFFDEDKNEIDDFEFNQDFEIDDKLEVLVG